MSQTETKQTDEITELNEQTQILTKSLRDSKGRQKENKQSLRSLRNQLNRLNIVINGETPKRRQLRQQFEAVEKENKKLKEEYAKRKAEIELTRSKQVKQVKKEEEVNNEKIEKITEELDKYETNGVKMSEIDNLVSIQLEIQNEMNQLKEKMEEEKLLRKM